MLSYAQIQDLAANHTTSVLDILYKLGGCYETPRDEQGRRIGPLVGYAGKDAKGRPFVGDVYANSAKLDEQPLILRSIANRMIHPLTPFLSEIDCFVGLPKGGELFGFTLAERCSKGYARAEKKVTAVATATSREQSELVFGRHEPEPGLRLAFVEDVSNNFSTTSKALELARQHECTVTCLVTLLNRSPHVDELYTKGEISLPVVAAQRKALPECEVDDPAVAEDIDKGNVVWKPKDEWSRLMVAVEQAKTH